MGLFSKKEACPVCGGEVKGLFLTRIGDKKILCKDCSRQISMNKDLLEHASPEFIREHLAYRRANAERYASLHWDIRYTGITGLEAGLDPAGKAIYLSHSDLHDEDNPVVFSFDQLTGYALYRRNKQVDSLENTGAVNLETGWSAVANITRLVNSEASSNVDSFHLKLTTSDPYWPEVDLKITFTTSQLHGEIGFGGFAGEMMELCQLLKDIVRKEPLSCVH